MIDLHIPNLLFLLMVVSMEWKFEIPVFGTSSISMDCTNGTTLQELPSYHKKQMLNPVTTSWLLGGRPVFLLSESLNSLLSVSSPSIFEPVPIGFLGVPTSSQPTLHPYSDRSTAKEADNSGRTSSEWNLWLTILIAMVAAAILS